MLIFCCACNRKVEARLTTGQEIYPHRSDLASRLYWICDACKNYVGCHFKRRTNPTLPLGSIPTPELRGERNSLHELIDPLWRGDPRRRRKLYNEIAKRLGQKEFHTAWIRSLKEVHRARIAVLEIIDGYGK